MRLLVPTLFLAAALAGCTDRPAAPATVDGTFTFIDDGADVPGFGTFRDSLLAVVARKDTAALLATVAPGARLSFGDDAGGPEGFRAMWLDGDPPGGTPVWDLLARILDAGSVDEDGAVTVPYVFGAWPDSIDAGTHVAVVGPGVSGAVEARVAPSDTADVVALVRHAILPAEAPAEAGFRRVRLPSGRSAIVPAERAMSPFGYRAIFFHENDGAWKFQTFIAGD